MSLIVTDLAVMRPSTDGLILLEIAPGWSVDEVQSVTGAQFIISSDLKEYEL